LLRQRSAKRHRIVHAPQSIAEFEANLSGNLYKLWNRMSSGSYFPPPVLRVDIPKADGGTRPLGIPTVADRAAQEVARRYLEPILEPVFHPDSYGYKPGKSAIDAVRKARERCWRYDWVLSFWTSRLRPDGWRRASGPAWLGKISASAGSFTSDRLTAAPWDTPASTRRYFHDGIVSSMSLRASTRARSHKRMTRSGYCDATTW
jgi:hypothetical protein